MDVVEICAGAGGQAVGLELAGFEHCLAVELDRDACQTLRANRDWKVAEGDVASRDVWKPEEYQGVALLAGGVPCPPFSIAGKQLGAADERDLFAYAVELCGMVQPRALLLENVRGLSTSRFAGYRQHILDRLEEFGYWAEWRLLQASDFGVPQLRPRFVLVAIRSENAAHFSWPQPGPPPRTVGETLQDLMGAQGWPGTQRWVLGADDIAPTIVGGSKKHGGADLGPTRAKRAWAALGVDGHGVADEAPGADLPEAHLPKLTLEMVARIQGWKDERGWVFEGRKTSRYRQVGNAFPPPVAAAVGQQIRKALLRRDATVVPRMSSEEAHDPVLRVLRRAPAPLTVDEIAVEADVKADMVRRRLVHLEHDFHVKVDGGDGLARYRLAGFKGFIGQDDHARHGHYKRYRGATT